MYRLYLNDNLIDVFPTKEKALDARNQEVRKLLYELRDNEQIDKYAVEDWLWELDVNKEDEYYVDECSGYNFVIMEIDWATARLEELDAKGRDNWDEDDYEAYYYCMECKAEDEADAEYLGHYLTVE